MSISHRGAGSPRSPLPLGEPRPLTVPHQGLQYRGEVVLSDHWDPAWGQPLEGDVYFRIILLRHRRQAPSSDIQDSRIAVCIPGRGPSRGRGHAGRELTALRETQALYITQRDPETAFIRSYLTRQREELEAPLVSEEAGRYASGHIESPTIFSEGIREFFTSPDPTTWFQMIAGALLSWAYPALPLESSLLSRPLTPEDIPRIYEAIFSPSTEDRAPLGEFGPALGLSKSQAPLTFDPGECQVFQQIRAELENRPGELLWKDIHPQLAHSSGLTSPLAILYLLAFVYYGQSKTELSLAPDHHLTFRDGRPVRGSTLTSEFIPFLPWQDDPQVQDALLPRKLSACASRGEKFPGTMPCNTPPSYARASLRWRKHPLTCLSRSESFWRPSVTCPRI